MYGEHPKGSGGDKGLDVKGILELIELDDPVDIVMDTHATLEVLSPEEGFSEGSDGSDSELSDMEHLRVSEVWNKTTIPYIITN